MGHAIAHLPAQNSDPPVRDFTDADLLHQAVILTRQCISRHGEPDPRLKAVGISLIWDLFEDQLDDIADGSTPDCAAAEAFWLGLTVGHMRIDGSVDIPYRLFPEASMRRGF
jgi:hypothetical protein